MKRTIDKGNYIHILGLQKRYHQDTCKNYQIKAIQKFNAKIRCLKNSKKIMLPIKFLQSKH
jgi:hypothetical protein